MTYPDIHPARAFRHPAFGAAVVLLFLNDHFFKGSGILPGVVTGKLSDVVGLFAAPVVLAWLVRVRTPRGLAYSAAATGVGFSLLQLIPGIGAGVEAILPVQIWADPTDLLALPALYLSYRVLLPEMGRERAQGATLQVTVGLLALFVCTATSYRPPDYPRSGLEFSAQTYLHNASELELYVTVVRPPENQEIDCRAVMNQPAYVETLDFDRADAYALLPGHNMPLRIGRSDPQDVCVVLQLNQGYVGFWADRAHALVPWEGRPNLPGQVTWNGQTLVGDAYVWVYEPSD